MQIRPEDLKRPRSSLAEHTEVRRRWPAGRTHAFSVLQPAAFALVLTEGPLSITVYNRDGDVKRRIGHNRAIWPARIAKTTQWRDAITPTYNVAPGYQTAVEFRLWCLTRTDRDAVAARALELMELRAEIDGGCAACVENGFVDLGPDVDVEILQDEIRGIAKKKGIACWDDGELEGFLDRVSDRVGRHRRAGRGYRDDQRAYDAAARDELDAFELRGLI